MGRKAGHAAILVNRLKDDSEGLARAMVGELAACGWSTSVCMYDDKPGPAPDLDDAEILVCLGGDGTVLYAARLAAPLGIPVLPVNLGHLGFIAWVGRAEWKDRFDDAVSGRLTVSERFMLDIVVERDGRAVGGSSALNDGVVSGAGPAKIVNLAISVGGAPLGRYRADGVIISTPTGSTAYSMAAGGPVLDPDMDAMLFTPICPFTLSNRPLVIPAGQTFEVRVEPDQRERTMLTIDGQAFFDLEEGDRVVVRRSAFRARLFRGASSSFHQVLRAKLNWSGAPDA